MSTTKKCNNNSPSEVVHPVDIDLLKTFLEVNKTRHFSKAADNLYVTSAAVSARVKLLEKQLGVVLFLRHRGNIRLTSEGERLLPLAETMINTWARTLQEVRLQPEMDARIHIGATSGLWLLSMQQKLLELTEKLIGLAIQAEGHSAEDLNNKLLDRTLDLVLLYDPPSSTEVKAEKIGEMTLVLASKNESSSCDEAISNDYIYVDWGTSFASFHARKFGEKPRANLHVNLASIALSMLEVKGAAYLPQSTVQTTPWLISVAGSPSFKRPIYACYRESNDRKNLVEEVVNLIRGIAI